MAIITFNDFMAEGALFEFSQENFDLIKEASEIRIMDLYLQSQSSMANGVLSSFGEGVTLSEGFMMESVGESEIQLLEEKFTDKVKNFGTRVKTFFLKLFKTVTAFFAKLVAKTVDLKAKTEKLIQHIDVGIKEITPADAHDIAEVVNAAVKESGVPISQKQGSRFNKLPKRLLTITDESVKNKLSDALVNTTIHMSISSSNCAWAFSEKQLEKFFSVITNREAVQKNMAAVRKVLDDFQKTNLKNGLMVSNDDAKLVELEKTLKELYNRFAQDQMDLAEQEEAHGWSNDQNFDNIFTDAMKVSTDTIKLYSSVNRYRLLVVTGLSRVLNVA